MMFTGAAAAALLAVWFLLLWSPKGSELSDARERKELAEQKVDELKLKLARLSAAQRREPELRATYDRIEMAIPDEPQLAQFILDANDAAAKAGVDFMSISPTQPAMSKVAGQPPVVAIKLEVSGDYFKTLDFLDRLADLSRLVVLDSVQLNPSDDNEKLRADLSGSIFTTQPPVSPSAATKTTPATASASTTTTTTVQP
jgi:Tfp pilus assembly protein PilO